MKVRPPVAHIGTDRFKAETIRCQLNEKYVAGPVPAVQNRIVVSAGASGASQRPADGRPPNRVPNRVVVLCFRPAHISGVGRYAENRSRCSPIRVSGRETTWSQHCLSSGPSSAHPSDLPSARGGAAGSGMSRCASSPARPCRPPTARWDGAERDGFGRPPQMPDRQMMVSSEWNSAGSISGCGSPHCAAATSSDSWLSTWTRTSGQPSMRCCTAASTGQTVATSIST